MPKRKLPAVQLARNRLNTAFTKALEADFALHGASAIARVREEEPVSYLKLVAAFTPRETSKPTPQLNDAAATQAIMLATWRALGTQPQVNGGKLLPVSGRDKPSEAD